MVFVLSTYSKLFNLFTLLILDSCLGIPLTSFLSVRTLISQKAFPPHGFLQSLIGCSPALILPLPLLSCTQSALNYIDYIFILFPNDCEHLKGRGYLYSPYSDFQYYALHLGKIHSNVDIDMQ